MKDQQLTELFGTFRKNHPSGLALCMCCASAFVAETATYPLDMLKTRVQVLGLQKNNANPGILRLGTALIRNEGILQLWSGLSPALLRHLIYTGSRVPIYEYIRRDVFHLPPAAHFTVRRKTNDGTQPSFIGTDETEYDTCKRDWRFVLRAASAGMIAGGTAQFLASPTDLMKVRLQTERMWQAENSFMALGNSTKRAVHVSPSSPGLIHTFRQLLAEGGILGLWRGGLPNVQRAALINMGELTTYDTAKRWYAIRFQLEDGPFLHTCSSATSGFVAAVVGTPADMIKTRIMNQRASHTEGLLYQGVIDCARKVIRSEGFFALYKGFFLIWARIAPWSLTFWLTYEKIRILIGVGGF